MDSKNTIPLFDVKNIVPDNPLTSSSMAARWIRTELEKLKRSSDEPNMTMAESNEVFEQVLEIAKLAIFK